MKPIQATIATCLLAGIAGPVAGQGLDKLLASDGTAGDWFGYSVAISGDLVLVGAPQGLVPHVGAAYLYNRNTRQELAKLPFDDVASDQWFGTSVALDGAIAVVGAPHDDDMAADAGAIYVYDVVDPANPELKCKLYSPEPHYEDYFGHSVAVSGNIIVVGTHMARHNDSNEGAAYLFNADTCQFLAELTVEDPGPNDLFGHAVAICGDSVVVGAYGTDDYAGAAYGYDVSDPANPVMNCEFIRGDPEPNDYFGWSVACSDEVAVVGAYLDDHIAHDDGSVYVFDLVTCAEITQFSAWDATADQNFGVSVAIDRDTVLVGAWQDCEAATMAGAAYLFDMIDIDNPAPVRKLVPCDAAADVYFGWAVALSGRTAVIGTFEEDELGEEAGAAYLFHKQWPSACQSDVTGPFGVPDGIVDVLDLLEMLTAWGPCCP